MDTPTLSHATPPTPPEFPDRFFLIAFPLIVLSLLLLLLAYYRGSTHYDPEASRPARAQADIAAFTEALETFRLDNSRYPTTTESLQALATQPPATPHWQKLLDDVKRDPWNHPYHYTSPGLRHPTSFDLSSNGPDNLPNTPDDLTN